MTKLVIDTDVLFAAFDSPNGASRHLLLAILDERFTLLLSNPLLIEYETVLTRPRDLARFGLSANDISMALDDLVRLCQPVHFHYRWRPGAHDPDDDIVLETAINGQADIIASFNLADLSLGARRFGIPVFRPVDVLRNTPP